MLSSVSKEETVNNQWNNGRKKVLILYFDAWRVMKMQIWVTYLLSNWGTSYLLEVWLCLTSPIYTILTFSVDRTSYFAKTVHSRYGLSILSSAAGFSKGYIGKATTVPSSFTEGLNISVLSKSIPSPDPCLMHSAAWMQLWNYNCTLWLNMWATCSYPTKDTHTLHSPLHSTYLL